MSRQVLASFGTDMVSVVMQDDYYCDQTHLSPEVRRQQNYDHPQAFEWPLLVQHVQALRKGESIDMPEYDFTLHNRSDRTIPVKPAPVIVIEGLFALYDADLCDMMSLKIFVDTASDVRFIRRMQRDITERGRSVESVIEPVPGNRAPDAQAIHRADQAQCRCHLAARRERSGGRHDHHQGGQRHQPAEALVKLAGR